MSTKTLRQLDINYERAAFWTLSSLVLAFMFGYSYFVNMSVRSVVGRQDAEQTISEVRAHISDLESIYFSHVNGMNLDLAVSYGLQEAEDVTFVSRKTLAKNFLTLNGF